MKMGEIIKTKLRKIGSSFGVLIPKRVILEESLKAGEDVEISILNKRRKEEAIKRLWGIAKGTKPFRRDHRDRF